MVSFLLAWARRAGYFYGFRTIYFGAFLGLIFGKPFRALGMWSHLGLSSEAFEGFSDSLHSIEPKMIEIKFVIHGLKG